VYRQEIQVRISNLSGLLPNNNHTGEASMTVMEIAIGRKMKIRLGTLDWFIYLVTVASSI
jgi:hypothetical protein